MSPSQHDPARAVVIDARPLGGEDARGNPLFVIDLTVLQEGHDPIRARTSVGVPAHAIRQLHPGAELDIELAHTGGGPVPVLRFGDPADGARAAVADPESSSTAWREPA